ncbi:MAG: four helix bundle protein [Ignavibacteriaceae bacterium]|jgi:four helix bundle protein
MTNIHFAFEDLEVWKKSITFAVAVINMIEELQTERKHFRLIEQIESSVTSIAMNIAEGKGRYSKKEYVQFLYYSRGSLNETITLIEIFKQKDWIKADTYYTLRHDGDEIGKMLSSLISSIKNSI